MLCTRGLEKQTAVINGTCANMHGFGFDLSDCMQSSCCGSVTVCKVAVMEV